MHGARSVEDVDYFRPCFLREILFKRFSLATTVGIIVLILFISSPESLLFTPWGWISPRLRTIAIPSKCKVNGTTDKDKWLCWTNIHHAVRSLVYLTSSGRQEWRIYRHWLNRTAVWSTVCSHRLRFAENSKKIRLREFSKQVDSFMHSYDFRNRKCHGTEAFGTN